MQDDSESVGVAAQLAAVFLAGGFGATLRVVLSGRIEQVLIERLPHAGVLIVNLIGCLLIGFATALIHASHWRNIVLGGLLGGFTTYSAFALFSFELIEHQRWGVLAVQLTVHLLGGLACVWLGLALARVLGFGMST